MSNLRTLLGPMRVPFLILTPACVFLAFGCVYWDTGPVNLFHLALVLVGALAAHISVNALNEYFDFTSGLDLKTTPTPFSGGSGTLPANPEKAPQALWSGLISFAVTALVGIYFLIVRGLGLLPLGLVGLLVIFTYTLWLNRSPLLCLIAPGLGFGTLMVMGSAFALTGSYSWTAFLASLVPFFLVNNLLLLNQFPDVEADRSIGRKTLPIVSGKKFSAIVYTLFLLATYLSIVAGVLLGDMPTPTLLGLLTILIAVPTANGVIRNANDTQKLMPAMGMNVLLNILTPVLVGIGFLIG